MVIETFLPGCRDKAYQRFHEKGRMIPDGLVYIDRWLERDGERCFQLMETQDPSLFSHRVKHWDELVRFEFVEIGEKSEKVGNIK